VIAIYSSINNTMFSSEQTFGVLGEEGQGQRGLLGFKGPGMRAISHVPFALAVPYIRNIDLNLNPKP
jgi:hypothetical protein